MGCNCFKNRTQAWWWCNKCKKHIVKVRSGIVKEAMRKHQETCIGAIFRIKQIVQGG